MGTKYIGIERLVKKPDFILTLFNNLKGVQCRTEREDPGKGR